MSEITSTTPLAGVMGNEGTAPGPRSWHASWIEPEQPDVTEEPTFTLADMFENGGKLPEQEPVEKRLHPSRLLKRVFDLPAGEVVQATLYMTAHGVYEALINGTPVSADLLAPGYTSYASYLEYQTYDVTLLVRAGQPSNVWGVVLADGWWAGRIATPGDSCQFGNRLAVLGELEVVYADGSVVRVGTDDSFMSSTGKWVYADICIGEKQDLRLEEPGWAESADVEGWRPVGIVDEGFDNLRPQLAPPVRAGAELAVASWWREGDTFVIDFGQVLVGHVRLACRLGVGQELCLQHAEALDAAGRFFMNIQGRNKDQADVYVGRGSDEVLEPHFTFHGFRYVRLSGWDAAVQGEFDPTRAVAVATWTDMRRTGHITTSDTRVNRLLDNVLWSQRGNMLAIPTDCPQRERAGWTGDAQVFAPTATFFMDVRSFLERWLECVKADQQDNGEVLDYSPAPRSYWACLDFTGVLSSAGWGDAIVLVPWTLYERYGDESALRSCYDAMLRWHEFCVGSAAGDKQGLDCFVWDTKFHYGDWMFPSYMMGADAPGPMGTAKATADVVATAYLAHTTDTLAKVARALGDEGRVAELEEYAGCVRKAFTAQFFKGDGMLTSEFQGPYVLALAFDMLPEGERQAVADRLAAMVRANGDKLDTGFLSVPYLFDVLGRFGYGELAERVFFQDGCPSWLYEVDRGATTIWESWAGIQPDGTVGAYSFNHYAFGCVADWFVRTVAGLSAKAPGFAEFEVVPHPMGGLTSCDVEYESAAGTIRVRWELGRATWAGVGERANELVAADATSARMAGLATMVTGGASAESVGSDAEDGSHGRMIVTVPAGARATLVTPSGKRVEASAGEHVVCW